MSQPESPESPESPEYKMIAHAALAAAGVIFSVIVALGTYIGSHIDIVLLMFFGVFYHTIESFQVITAVFVFGCLSLALAICVNFWSFSVKMLRDEYEQNKLKQLTKEQEELEKQEINDTRERRIKYILFLRASRVLKQLEEELKFRQNARSQCDNKECNVNNDITKSDELDSKIKE